MWVWWDYVNPLSWRNYKHIMILSVVCRVKDLNVYGSSIWSELSLSNIRHPVMLYCEGGVLCPNMAWWRLFSSRLPPASSPFLRWSNPIIYVFPTREPLVCAVRVNHPEELTRLCWTWRSGLTNTMILKRVVEFSSDVTHFLSYEYLEHFIWMVWVTGTQPGSNRPLYKTVWTQYVRGCYWSLEHRLKATHPPTTICIPWAPGSILGHQKVTENGLDSTVSLNSWWYQVL